MKGGKCGKSRDLSLFPCSMEYRLVRSRRKSIALTVDRSGNVVVRAPLDTPKSVIDDFVQSKTDWIDKYSAQAEDRVREKTELLSKPPLWLPLMGEECPVVNKQPYGYIDGCFRLPEDMALERMIPYLRKLYASIAKDTLPARTRLIAGRMNVNISDVKINSAKTRWGSCSSTGSTNLSWKLIAADLKLIDYVIVHELCHVGQMNHSPEFWAKVEAVIPDYKQCRERLKDVQKTLVRFGLD